MVEGDKSERNAISELMVAVYEARVGEFATQPLISGMGRRGRPRWVGQVERVPWTQFPGSGSSEPVA